MQRISYLLVLAASIAASYPLVRTVQMRAAKSTILSVTMNLSAMGVESDNYPSIVATLDFERHTSRCARSYFDPAYPSSTYHLSTEELNTVQRLLQKADLKQLKTTYTVNRTDQPTSTTIIRTASQVFTIKDYGLEGGYPLPELYRVVYKQEY